MAYTLLHTVKAVLSEMSSDDVDSINDTIEAKRVASLVRDVYQSVMTEYPWLVNENYINPITSSESLIELQPNITHVKGVFIKPSVECGSSTKLSMDEDTVFNPLYTKGSAVTASCNTNNGTWQELQYVDKADMLGLTFRETQPDSTDASYVMYGYHTGTNANPRYYTIINNHIVLNSICKKTYANFPLNDLRVLGQYTADIALEDGAVINLNPQLYSYFLAESKSQSFYSIKQMPNQKLEQIAQRLGRQLKNSKSRQGKNNTKIGYPQRQLWRYV